MVSKDTNANKNNTNTTNTMINLDVYKICESTCLVNSEQESSSACMRTLGCNESVCCKQCTGHHCHHSLEKLLALVFPQATHSLWQQTGWASSTDERCKEWPQQKQAPFLAFGHRLSLHEECELFSRETYSIIPKKQTKAKRKLHVTNKGTRKYSKHDHTR